MKQNVHNDELEMIISPGQKQVKKNGAAKPLSRLIGMLKVVLFSPEQLDIIDGPPRRRRRFLDSLLSQVNFNYTMNLLAYQKALHQRNALLAAIKEGSGREPELYFWDKELVLAGQAIFGLRTELAAALNRRLNTFYQAVSGGEAPLVFVPQFARVSLEALEQHRGHDIRFGATTIGPHRDNFTIKLSGHDLSLFGSRGERRSALFALKAAEAEYLAAASGELPILLFDDVFSELDSFRKGKLFSDADMWQTFLTTTEVGNLPAKLKKSAAVIEVAKYAQPL